MSYNAKKLIYLNDKGQDNADAEVIRRILSIKHILKRSYYLKLEEMIMS